MIKTVCNSCGKKFTYKDKLLAVWVSPMGRMSVECCGCEYAPTLLSKAVFFGLLYISVIFAFYVSVPAFFGIMLAWFLALSFLTPLFTRLKTRRRFTANDSFISRVLSKTTWSAPPGCLYTVIIINIVNYRTYPNADHISMRILVSAVALAAVFLIILVIAVIRVLLENKKRRRT